MLACNEAVSPETVDLGYDYFPLNTGDLRVYEVTRIDHNLDQSSDTLRYQLKEVVGEKFSSGGEESFRLERFTRLDETEEWQEDSVWSARRNTFQAVVVENNVPIIKLSFPLEEDRRWDGNAMNSKEYDEFKMVNLDAAYTVNGVNFAPSLEMVKEEALDATQRVTDSFHKEYFARDIGMIYRIDIDRKYCSVEDCVEPGIIEFGLEVEYKLIEYQLLE